MTRVDELQKKYPSIPREIIIRLDVIQRGLRDNDDMDKGSRWTPGLWSYQSFERDVTLGEMAKQRPHRFKEGLILLPDKFFMNNGLATTIHRYSKSIYEIKDIGGGRFGLFEGGEKVEEVFFCRPKPRTGPEPLTSKGTPIGSLVASEDCCFAVVALRSCEYFSAGEECKFCTFNPAHEQVRRLGVIYRPVTIDLEDTVEAYKIRSSETRLLQGCFMMGGLRNGEQEAKIHFDFIKQIAKAAPYKPNFVCITQETTRKDMQRLKDVGLDCIRIQLEVWGRQLFEEICPGKASHAPYERWLECMQEGVEIFGFGSVGGQIMTGLNMMSPNAPKTWQEGRDSHIEAYRWMVKNGIFPFGSVVRVERGGVLGQDVSNWEKLPPTEYHLDAALGHHQACEEYGIYERVNKMMDNEPFRSGSGGYNGEIGKLARSGGDMGKWLSTFVPHDQNWLAQFMASTRLLANSQ